MSVFAVAARWRGLMSWRARPALRRGWWLAAIALLLVAALTWWAVPWLVRKVATEQVHAQLGRKLSMGDIRFKPWALVLELDDMALAGSAHQATVGPSPLKIARVRLNLSAASLWRLAPVIESLEVDGVELRLSRTRPGAYDVDDILQHLAKQPSTPDAPAPHFAIYNLRVSGLKAEFDDQPAGRVHRLEQGLLTLPFLSNQDDEIDILVEPRLAFLLDGARFDSGAQATPFGPDREAVLALKLSNLDLAPWLPYWPASLPVRPSQGHWSADVTVSFAQPPGQAPRLAVGGHLDARAVNWTTVDGQALLGWDALSLGLGQVQPLQRQVALESLKVEGLQATLLREPSGQLALLKALSRAVPQPASQGGGAPTPGRDWTISLKRLELPNARLHWRDLSVRPQVSWLAQNVQVRGEQLRWPLPQDMATMPLSISGEWGPEGAAQVPARWTADVRLGAPGGRLQLSLDDWPLAWWRPYQPAALRAHTQGQLGLRGEVNWTNGGGEGSVPHIDAKLARLQIDRLQISAPGQAGLLTMRQLSLNEVGLKWPEPQLSIAQVMLDQAQLKAARFPQGELDLLAWWQPPEGTAPAAVASDAAESTPWQVKLGLLEWQAAQVSWRDAPHGRALDLVLSAWNGQLRDVQWPASKPWALQGSARLKAAADQRSQMGGQMRWSGELAPSPFSWRGKVETDRLPLHLLLPYVPGLPLDIQRAELSWRGLLVAKLADAGPSWSAQGDATVTDFQALAPGASASSPVTVLGEVAQDELLSWQTLTLPELEAQGAPGQAPQIKVGVVVLADAFARLVVTEEGRLNLTALAPPAAASATQHTPPPVPVTEVASAATAATAAAPGLLLKLAGVRLQNGRVDFSDRFVRPNYRADLTALNGQLGAVSNPPQGPARLSLQGRAAGTAALDIQGQVQPFSQPLSLDIEARANDLELAPLTPYAAKYAGYAIERGKLSMKVGYQVQADGQLKAQNQLILNQLTFGERVDSPEATRLPVALAVALLKDRHGVIDLNLPIEGSLNDPQFRLGPVVLKLVLNLLGKALTSPFSLLSGGGSDELSQVAFEPGTARLSEAARSGLDKVALALQERPGLTLTVHTALDLSPEREALRAAALAQRLQAERRKELARAGEDVPQGELALSDSDRSRLLTRLYADARLPNKPRNVLGLEKSLPPVESEALLRGAVVISAEQMRELALQRGLAVRDALVAKGLSGERIFLAAPSAKVAGVAESAASASHWAGLTLGTP